MVGWLGRVKERAPGGELPSRQYRKSFDDDHGRGTFWTAETSGLGGGGRSGCRGVRQGMVGEQVRLLLSGSLLRKLTSEGKPVPAEFSKPEVIAILKPYYDTLEEKVEVKLHGAATGVVKPR
jgi:hypothetical protein